MIEYVIQKRLVFPSIYSSNGENKIVYKIDSALMNVGFKLSHNLFVYLRNLDEVDALEAGMKIITNIKKLVGDNVKHNTYFKRFPDGIPDTFEFWFDQIVKFFCTGTCEYGRYQHSYEEMLLFHESFKDKFGSNYRVIHLGQSLSEELNRLYGDLAGSSVPLSPEDRDLLYLLVDNGYIDNTTVIPVRENKAVINSFLAKNKKPLIIDTLTDILRVAVVLSDGDPTLEKDTKIRSLPRYIRRTLLRHVDEIARNNSKIEDIFTYREAWKRFGEKLHPHESTYENAQRVFAIVRGDLTYNRWAGSVQNSFLEMDYSSAIDLLEQKPGYLFRNIDRITRQCTNRQFDQLLRSIRSTGSKVSARVLLSLREFMINRNNLEYRVFVNYKGKAHVEKNNLKHIEYERINQICSCVDDLLVSHLPKNNLLLDIRLKEFSSISLPLSEKNKSDGFDVLPRGSSVVVGKERNIVRFFVYWKQKSASTDYDLSCVFYDKDFNFVNQVSWTHLQASDYATHSGDLTSAPNGASEFIDIKSNKLPSNVYYFVPTVNVFSGETFADTSECFFGYMERDLSEFGKPFEPKTVKTKFALRGKGKICMPLAFYKEKDTTHVKWTDLYLKGISHANMIERNQLSTGSLAKGIVDRQYLTLEYLLSLYEKAGVNIQYTDQITSDVIGLNNLSRLIV